MEKKLVSYETLFVINGNYAEDAAKAVEEKFVTLANENATEVAVDEWGKRKLAYEINYVTEGYYVLLTYKSEPTFPLEIERVLGITEGIIRHMTTLKTCAGVKSVKEEPKAEENAVATEATEA